MKRHWLRYGLRELRFVKSGRDVRILFEKAAYLLPRAMGRFHRHTPVPRTLQIEPTNHCNLDCICCTRPASVRKRGYMEFDLFKHITDDASRLGVKKIRLFLLGEPLLHPRIVDMIACTKTKRIRVHLVTNGMLLDRDLAAAILESGVDSGDRVIVSVLGYSQKVHEMIMRGVDHSGVVDNIHNFVRLRKERRRNGPVIETVFYTMPENETERNAFYRHWHNVVDHVRIEPKISRQFAEFKSEATDRPLPARRKTCVYLWDRLTIFWDGDATVCIADLDGTHRLGNLGQRSIADIWNCETLMSLKKAHREKRFADLPMCSHCDW